MVQWQNVSFPRIRCGFDSRYPLKNIINKIKNMHEIILTVALLLVIFYVIYLNFAKRSLWEDLQVEKI